MSAVHSSAATQHAWCKQNASRLWLSWLALFVTLIAATPGLAEDSPAPPAIVPLEPVPLPPAPRGELTFGEIEFEMPPEKPARPAPKPPNPAGKGGRFEIVSVEFEMPPEPAGELTFGEITFEFDPKDVAKAEVDRIGKAVKEVLKNQKKASKSISKKLDQLEKQKGKPKASSKRWHARGIPGGNVEVGILRTHVEAESATYVAPDKIPGDPVVPIQIRPEGGGDDLSGAAEVTVLDTDAVLEARWSVFERLVVTYDKTEQGPFGNTVYKDRKSRTISGSGTVRFEDRPYPGMTRAEWEETRAGMIGTGGIRPLQAVSADGDYRVDGSGSYLRRGPQGWERSQTSVTGETFPVGFPGNDINVGVILKTDGKNWSLSEWNFHDWDPQVRITETSSHQSWRKESGTHSWTSTHVVPQNRVEVFGPLNTPDKNTAPSVTASRTGSLTLTPVSEDHFTGSIRFRYRNATPEDGVSTNVMEREVTWTFDLRIAK